jgi:hypothetical protein
VQQMPGRDAYLDGLLVPRSSSQVCWLRSLMSDAPGAIARSDNSESRWRGFYDGGSCRARVSDMQTQSGATELTARSRVYARCLSHQKVLQNETVFTTRNGAPQARQVICRSRHAEPAWHYSHPAALRRVRPPALHWRSGRRTVLFVFRTRIVLTSRFTRDWLRRSTAGDGQAGPPVRPSRSRSPAAFVAEGRGRTR